MDKIAVLGGNDRFHNFLYKTGVNAVKVSDISAAIKDVSYNALILLPDYDNGEETVRQLSLADITVLAERKREGFRIYAENYDSYNTYNASVFGYEVIGKICHINTETICAFKESI